MSVITLLSPHVADLIAAGEVVERPASVVKELVENAIDAGAKNITVEITGGGMRSIRVTDDGCGMSPEDAGIAFLRHATSKLHDEQGLEGIQTLGFRGEALAAISAVSHIELITRERDAEIGTRVLLDGGEIQEMEPVGCPAGSSLRVQDLFYNTPARQKFVKSDRAEASACISAALRCALGHPEIALRMEKDGEEQFFSPGDGQIKSAVYSLLGRETAMSLLECSGGNDSVSVQGFVSAPHAGRGNRSMQFFFLNGRTFHSATLQAALEQAYRNTLLTGRFPACALYLTLAYNKVDVNVHPSKNEVKFTEEKKVFDAVYSTVRGALEEKSQRNAPPLRLDSSDSRRTEPEQTVKPFFQTMSLEQFREFTQTETPPKSPTVPDKTAERHQPPRQPHRQAIDIIPDEPYFVKDETPPPLPAPETPPQPAPPAFRLVGEIMNTYIVVESENTMLLIDKHACHERIIFDQLLTNRDAQMGQTLITPRSWSPGGEAVELLEQNQELLAQTGFAFERFGEDGIILRTVPADLDGDEIAVLEEILEQLKTGRAEDRRDEICHTIACKAAIKAGKRSDPRELEALAARVISGEIRYCPHGRPVSVKITRKELDKQFQRIV